MIICFLVDYLMIGHVSTFSVSDHNLLQFFLWLILTFICLKFLSGLSLIMIKFILHGLTNKIRHHRDTWLPAAFSTTVSGIPKHLWCFQFSYTPTSSRCCFFVYRIMPLSTVSALQDWKQVLSFWRLPWIFWFLRNFHRISLYFC